MSSQAGRHTGLAVCLSGVTSVTAKASAATPTIVTTTPTTTSKIGHRTRNFGNNRNIVTTTHYPLPLPAHAGARHPILRTRTDKLQVLRQRQSSLRYPPRPLSRTRLELIRSAGQQFTLTRPHQPLRLLHLPNIISKGTGVSNSHAARLLSTTAAPCYPHYYAFHLTLPEPSAARRSFPHLAALRSKLGHLPSLMAAATSLNGTRAHSGGSGGPDDDNHNHTHSHDHGHSHSHGFGHHHHHGANESAFLTSTDRSDPGVRITRIGLVSNLAMAIAKFAGGWAFNSRAMTADAWHSITDLASDVLTLTTVSWSLRPPNEQFPMGFGKVESLGSLGVSGMLLAGGMYMGWESGISLYGHFYPEAAHHILDHLGHGHGHSHSHSAAALGIPSMHAAWLAAGTILIKEWLYHATMKVATERKSSVLASNAVHHRVDSLTGFVTLAAILGANTLENAAWLDPVGGLLISVLVIQAGLGNTMAAIQELTDKGIDDEMKKSIRKQAQKALVDMSDRHEVELVDVSGIKSGQNYMIDLEMLVPGAWSVEESKKIEDAVRTQVGSKVRGVRRVRVRFAPKERPVANRFDEFIPASLKAPTEDEDASDHDEKEHGQHKQ